MLRFRWIVVLIAGLLMMAGESYAASGWVKVEVEPEAMVMVDGRALVPHPTRKIKGVVDAGIRQVSAEAPGYIFEALQVDVPTGGSVDVYLSLVKEHQNRDTMASVSAGSYEVGANAETVKWLCKGMKCEQEYKLAEPAHNVTVAAFSIDKYEVTNQQYKKFVQAAKHPAPKHWKGGDYTAQQDDYPVVNVSLQDAAAYCKWAGKRLPTEMEWEVAARGGRKVMYPWGPKYHPGFANVDHETYKSATITGRYGRALGHSDCYDTIGNVWEWTSSTPTLYSGSTGKLSPQDASKAVIRGGSFNDPTYMGTTAYRKLADPNAVSEDIGFRCVK